MGSLVLVLTPGPFCSNCRKGSLLPGPARATQEGIPGVWTAPLLSQDSGRFRAQLRRKPNSRQWALELPGTTPVASTSIPLQSTSVRPATPRALLPQKPEARAPAQPPCLWPLAALPLGTKRTPCLDWLCSACLQAPRLSKESSERPAPQGAPAAVLRGAPVRWGWVGPPK